MTSNDFELHTTRMKESFEYLRKQNCIQAANELCTMCKEQDLKWYLTEEGLFIGIPHHNSIIQFANTPLQCVSLLDKDNPNVDNSATFKQPRSDSQSSNSSSSNDKNDPTTRHKKRRIADGLYKPPKSRQPKHHPEQQQPEQQQPQQPDQSEHQPEQPEHQPDQQQPEHQPQQQQPDQQQPEQLQQKPPQQTPQQPQQPRNIISVVNNTWSTFQQMPNDYNQTIKARLHDIITLDTNTINDNLQELLTSTDFINFSSNLLKLDGLTNTKQKTLIFYKHISAYYKFLAYNAITPTDDETAMMIMTTRFGYNPHRFMDTIRHGEAVHNILESFGIAGLVATEYFKMQTITSYYRYQHINSCKQDTKLVEYFKDISRFPPLKPLIEDIPYHIINMINQIFPSKE